MKVKNSMLAILNAINGYAFNCGLETNEENAYEAASFVRDIHYETWGEEIEIDLDELDKQFNIYHFCYGKTKPPPAAQNGGGFFMMGGCSAHSGRNDGREKEQRNPPHLHSITSTQAGEAF